MAPPVWAGALQLGTGLLQSGPGNQSPPWGLLSWKENTVDLLFCKVVEVQFLAMPLPTLNEIPRLRSWRTPFPSVPSELFSPLPPPPSSCPPSPWLLLLSSLPSLPSCFSSCWAPTTWEVSEEAGVGGPLWNARGVGHEAGWWWSRGRRHLGDLAGTGKEETGFGLSYSERTGKARIIWVRGRCEWRSRRRNI